MFNSTVLDVAIGLAFTFMTVALVASAVTEAIASILKRRSATLLKGVKDLLNDRQFDGLAKDLYNSALVSPRDDGQAATESALKDAPSYIDPGHFADALMAAAGIGTAAGNAWTLRQRLRVGDPQIRALLEAIIDRSAGDIAKVRNEIAQWFDAAMDRVGGAYKRWAQLVSFIAAFVIAGGLNISAIHIAAVLWQRPLIADAIKPTQDPRTALEELEKLPLPIGWDRYLAPVSVAAKANPSRIAAARGGWKWWPFSSNGIASEAKPAAPSYRPWSLDDLGTWGILEMVVGWLITAVAALFGAPFWFDLLQLIIRLKGSGPSPAEKERRNAAAA